MRLPLIALLVVASASPLVAQSTATPRRAEPRPTTYNGPNPYTHPQYRMLVPKLSMDSAVFIIESKYAGWHVDSKVLTRERGRPIYIFGMIAGGEVGARQLRVDADDGNALNPEVLGLPADSTGSDHDRQHERSRTSHP